MGLWEPRSDRAIQECVLTFAGASAASRPSGNERRCSVSNIFGVCETGVWRRWFGGFDYCVMDPAYTSNLDASCRLDWVKKTGAAPKLQKGIDILDNDHGVIHGAIYSLGTASRELIAALSGEVSGRDGDAPRVADRLAGEIEGFDRTLLRHLEDEEDLIIPLHLGAHS